MLLLKWDQETDSFLFNIIQKHPKAAMIAAGYMGQWLHDLKRVRTGSGIPAINSTVNGTKIIK